MYKLFEEKIETKPHFILFNFTATKELLVSLLGCKSSVTKIQDALHFPEKISATDQCPIIEISA